MKLLSIETSSPVCGICLTEDGNLIDIREERIPRQHAQKLPLFFNNLINQTDLSLDSLDGISISIGPGSFTGLRIGLSYAKGLAYSSGLPIIPVPTLYSLASTLESDADKVRVLLHSHADVVFCQDFKKVNSKIEKLIDPVAGSWTEFLETLSENDQVVYCGDEKTVNWDKYKLKVTRAETSARYVAYLAEKHFDEWLVKKPQQLVPDYISPFEVK